ncbi:MAG: transcription factor S [Hadesarchaea archaeon]|nr:transcription factor S [Hadesarchaea archaeon]
MEFCPKCGNLMLPKKIKENFVLTCSACGHSKEATRLDDYRLVKRSKRKVEPIIVEDTPMTLPTTHVTCPSCGHDKAYWWIRQTRSADEPSTRFYRCVKCSRVWREYA